MAVLYEGRDVGLIKGASSLEFSLKGNNAFIGIVQRKNNGREFRLVGLVAEKTFDYNIIQQWFHMLDEIMLEEVLEKGHRRNPKE